MVQRHRSLGKEDKLKHLDILREVMQYGDDKINCSIKISYILC